jgi:hypothetical protein
MPKFFETKFYLSIDGLKPTANANALVKKFNLKKTS